MSSVNQQNIDYALNLMLSPTPDHFYEWMLAKNFSPLRYISLEEFKERWPIDPSSKLARRLASSETL